MKSSLVSCRHKNEQIYTDIFAANVLNQFKFTLGIGTPSWPGLNVALLHREATRARKRHVSDDWSKLSPKKKSQNDIFTGKTLQCEIPVMPVHKIKKTNVQCCYTVTCVCIHFLNTSLFIDLKSKMMTGSFPSVHLTDLQWCQQRGSGRRTTGEPLSSCSGSRYPSYQSRSLKSNLNTKIRIQSFINLHDKHFGIKFWPV